MRLIIARFVALALVVSASGASPRTPDVAAPTVVNIDRAWSNRLTQVGCFLYEAHLTEENAVTEKWRGNDPFQPLGRTIPGKFATVEKDLVIKRDGTKSWTSVKGGHWDTDAVEAFNQSTVSAFDGTTYSRLITSSRAPFGLGHFGKRGTDAELSSRTLYEFPVLWWCDPKSLMPPFGDKLENLTFVSQAITSAGYPSMKLELRHDKLLCTSLIVMKTSPFLPLQVATYIPGKRLANMYELQYARESNGRDRLSTWSVTSFDSDGNVLRRQKGKVTKFAQADSFPDEDFQLHFPVGTNIIQYSGKQKRFWIQHTAVQMKALKATDYGKLPKQADGPVL